MTCMFVCVHLMFSTELFLLLGFSPAVIISCFMEAQTDPRYDFFLNDIILRKQRLLSCDNGFIYLFITTQN